jgi:molybdate transport system regulatory protein
LALAGTGLVPGTMRPMQNDVFSMDALTHQPADKRMDILRLIGDTGSISEAARQAGVSYKAAWQAVHTLTNLAGVVLVDRAVGGAGGGGARLTAAGEQLLDASRQMDVARQEVLARFSGGAAQALPGAGLRTSMRNNLPCQVTQLLTSTPDDPMVRVILALPQAARLTASITRESAELLGLQPGLALLALCKATAVRMVPVAVREPVASKPEMVGAAPMIHGEPDRSAANLIVGKVARLSRGGQRDEVVMTLPGDLQLVGFANQPNRLRVGSKVCAQVEENAVVLARV